MKLAASEPTSPASLRIFESSQEAWFRGPGVFHVEQKPLTPTWWLRILFDTSAQKSKYCIWLIDQTWREL